MARPSAGRAESSSRWTGPGAANSCVHSSPPALARLWRLRAAPQRRTLPQGRQWLTPRAVASYDVASYNATTGFRGHEDAGCSARCKRFFCPLREKTTTRNRATAAGHAVLTARGWGSWSRLGRQRRPFKHRRGGEEFNRHPAVVMEFTALEKYRAAQQSQTETFCCFERAESGYNSLLIGGRSDGALVLWRMQDATSRYGGLSRDNKEEFLKSRRHHQGSVNALVYSEDSHFGTGSPGGLLFSGSADRTIKVWDVWADKQQDETCVQTLVGHGATVTDIVCSGRGSVISCARDCTFRIWKPLPGREMLLHAFFVCAQVDPRFVLRFDFHLISPLLSALALPCQTVTLSGSSADGWANAMSVMTAPHWSLFVGDAAGTISVFAPRQDASSAGAPTAPSQELEQKEAWSHIHQLGISVLKTVSEHNFLISISFDCKVRIAPQFQMRLSFLGSPSWARCAWPVRNSRCRHGHPLSQD